MDLVQGSKRPDPALPLSNVKITDMNSPEYRRHETGVVEGLHTMGHAGSLDFSLSEIPQKYIDAAREKLARLELEQQAIVDDYVTVWDEGKFDVARKPIDFMMENDRFSDPITVPSCHSMPIKLTNSDSIRIPVEYEQFLPEIMMSFAAESLLNPNLEQDYFGYLGVDQTYVFAGDRQRSSAIHSDGIQGPRINPKLPIEHTYIRVDRDPFRSYVQPFPMGEATSNTHLLTPIFGRLADEAHAFKMSTKALGLIDAYSVHDAVDAAEDGLRTMFKLTFAPRKFDRLGSTKNVLLDYEWEMFPRPLPTDLIEE